MVMVAATCILGGGAGAVTVSLTASGLRAGRRHELVIRSGAGLGRRLCVGYCGNCRKIACDGRGFPALFPNV